MYEGTVAQQANPLPAGAGIPNEYQSLVALLPDSAPCLYPEKAVKDGPSPGAMHPSGKPGRSSRLRASDPPSSGHCSGWFRE